MTKIPSPILFLGVLVVLLGSAARPNAVRSPICSNAVLYLYSDYSFLIGSANYVDSSGIPEAGSSYRWLINGIPSTSDTVGEGLLLHFDNAANGANGEAPVLVQNASYPSGKWGNALALPANGKLQYSRDNNLNLPEGTIEMWVALRANGDDSVYTSRSHTLFHYRAANGDTLSIAQSNTSSILYFGGTVNGQWQSAYGSNGNMRGWKAGDWHHLAATYSATGNFMRFYVDGVLTANTNEKHYWTPAATGTSFAVGSDIWNTVASYLVDEVHLSNRAASSAEIAARANRFDQPRANEVWRTTQDLVAGSTIQYEFTPSANGANGSPCQSNLITYSGIPITNPQPPSTILIPGATSVALGVTTMVNTTCAYRVGAPVPYPQMTPFSQGNGTLSHQTMIGGMDSNPNVVNQVYVRCASNPDYLLALRYRARSNVNPSFPRTGNLWGMWNFIDKGLAYMARIDLWLGADPTRDQTIGLRQLNPNVLILTSINAVENDDLPDDYYLKDVKGHKIEVWPGSFRLNLTKNYVAEYQARYAYQRILDGGLMYDGVFFDNVMTTQSWLTQDIYGNAVQIDADENGVADNPTTLDAAWKAGVFHELQTFRQLMPYALISSHSTNIFEPGIAEIFNGNSLGFVTTNVLENEMTFPDLWDMYNAWMTQAQSPRLTMFEASPPDQIAYGYDYDPLQKIPPSTLEFARTLYPYMRFGLALSLMNDGYFAYEYGDTWHGNDWWYDELDFNLGYPLGPAQRANLGFDIGPNQIVNGSFESAIGSPWLFWADTANGYTASVTRDTTTSAVGSGSARINIASTAGVDWRINFYQDNRALVNGTTYDLSFWAKSNVTRTLTLGAQKNTPNWDDYGLSKQVTIGPTWQPYTVTFQSTATANDARIQFFVGTATGTVWLDDVRLTLHPPDVFQREFTNGIALLNGTKSPQTITLGSGYRRLVGSQAPRFESLIDDTGTGFSTPTGTWITTTFDSGEWKAVGPFYHNWGTSVHKLTSAQGESRWVLPISATDVYTITAWLPAAPEASTWNQNARYEIIVGGQIVASTTLNQTVTGDEWRVIGTPQLGPNINTYVRLVCSGAPCIADALYIRSAVRHNDGSPASTVTLPPLDGIILQNSKATDIFLPLVVK